MYGDVIRITSLVTVSAPTFHVPAEWYTENLLSLDFLNPVKIRGRWTKCLSQNEDVLDLRHFETRVRQRRLVSKREAEFRTF